MAEILKILEALGNARGDEVEAWFAARRREAPPFFYSSVDLRHSGGKIAAVDTNLFPAGFNNLSPAAQSRASRSIVRFMREHYPQAKRVAIIPENHTRNLPYLDNVAALMGLFETNGVTVELGSLIAGSGKPVVLQSPSGRTLTQYPLRRDGNRLALENGFAPDLIIVNNDMTSGSPEILQSLEQPVLPPVGMGWYRRRKSVHFAAYKQLVDAFGLQFSIDPWLLSAEFHQCGVVDFKARTGLDCVAAGIDKVLARVRVKYREYGIADTPYVFVKADSGTYGMGIMTVRSGEEILELNKKDRNKMQVIKEGTPVHEVIIQEGVPTIDRVGGKPAEPLMYLIDGIPVGGMYRVNGQRDAYGNLNAAGMEFTGMCDEVETLCGEWKTVEPCHFRSFGIIAALAALAAAREDYEALKPLPVQLCC